MDAAPKDLSLDEMKALTSLCHCSARGEEAAPIPGTFDRIIEYGYARHGPRGGIVATALGHQIVAGKP